MLTTGVGSAPTPVEQYEILKKGLEEKREKRMEWGLLVSIIMCLMSVLITFISMLELHPQMSGTWGVALTSTSFYEAWRYRFVSTVLSEDNNGFMYPVVMVSVGTYTSSSLFGNQDASDSFAFISVNVDGQLYNFYRFPIEDFSISASPRSFAIMLGMNRFTQTDIRLDLAPHLAENGVGGVSDDATLRFHGNLNLEPRDFLHWFTPTSVGLSGWMPTVPWHQEVWSVQNEVSGVLGSGNYTSSWNLDFNGATADLVKEFGSVFPKYSMVLRANYFHSCHKEKMTEEVSLWVNMISVDVLGTEMPHFNAVVLQGDKMFTFSLTDGASVSAMEVDADSHSVHLVLNHDYSNSAYDRQLEINTGVFADQECKQRSWDEADCETVDPWSSSSFSPAYVPVWAEKEKGGGFAHRMSPALVESLHTTISIKLFIYHKPVKNDETEVMVFCGRDDSGYLHTHGNMNWFKYQFGVWA